MSTITFTEDSYEKTIIQLFEEMGYDHVYGPNIDRDFSSPLYDDVLEDSITKINKELPPAAIKDALYKLRNFENADLVHKNQVFMDYMQNGVPVSYFYKGEERSSIVYLADYKNPENNSFVVANQWTIIENSNKRPDVILFVNGLPLVVMELKSPSREETDASEAYSQLRNYMMEIPSLFTYNAICVISDMVTTKAGTITSGLDRFMEWKTKDGEREDKSLLQFETFFEGMFHKDRILDIIKNFICFSNDGTKLIKILAGYHQYYAVKKAIISTKHASVTDGKGGVFWHTQGSGKSLSMVFFAHLLQEAMDSPTIVVLTDRNDLDDQLYNQFAKCSAFLRQTPVHAKSREHLRQWLSGKVANGIIFTTMQKFEEYDDALSERRNIVVMADEAHRGQYGLAETIKITKNEQGEDVARRVIGTARIIRNSLPNATYIGFTGTPISAKDRNTREVFGDYIDIYDMTQAVEDGATRPVYYESRVVKLQLDEATLQLIDTEYELMAHNTDPEVIEKSKKALGQMEAVLGNENTINSLVTDILEHYENYRMNLLTGKAMIVAYSRPIAMKIYKKILELRPGWTEKVCVVMTSGNQDPEEWHDIIGNKQHKEELATKFKDDINSRKKISFKYTEYNRYKEKVFRNYGEVYELSPYALFWNEDYYYVVGWSDKHDNVSVFRTDRLYKPGILNDDAVPEPEDFNLENYSKEIFEMFDGEEVDVVLECKNEFMKYIIDRFGEDVDAEPISRTTFEARVRVSLSPTFYAWVFTFGGGIRIVSPDNAVEDIIAMSKKLIKAEKK